MQKVISIKSANEITGGLTQTSKMPCKSYSLPTIACVTGYEMRNVAGSICSKCYACKGFYAMYETTIEPSQMARLSSIDDPEWRDAMVRLIGYDPFFRWHDSGDLQSAHHLSLIVSVCEATPKTMHWLPTREYGMVKEYLTNGGKIPANLVIRLSAMFPDKPVIIPKSLQNIDGITATNVHTVAPIGKECTAYQNDGKCGDCRDCWNRKDVISYPLH